MSEISKHLGECIYRKRKEAKLTQAELAERTSVTEQTIRKIEHGEGNPQLDVLYGCKEVVNHIIFAYFFNRSCGNSYSFIRYGIISQMTAFDCGACVQ